MKKLNFCTLAISLLLFINATAQTAKRPEADASEATVKNLVIKNASALGFPQRTNATGFFIVVFTTKTQKPLWLICSKPTKALMYIMR